MRIKRLSIVGIMPRHAGHVVLTTTHFTTVVAAKLAY